MYFHKLTLNYEQVQVKLIILTGVFLDINCNYPNLYNLKLKFYYEFFLTSKTYK